MDEPCRLHSGSVAGKAQSLARVFEIGRGAYMLLRGFPSIDTMHKVSLFRLDAMVRGNFSQPHVRVCVCVCVCAVAA